MNTARSLAVTVIVSMLFVLLPAASIVCAEDVFTHTEFDNVLKMYVDEHGLVDYQGLSASPGMLEEYLAKIAAHSPDTDPQMFPTKNHRFAYWLNAYNAAALMLAADNYPIASVQDVPPNVLGKKSGYFLANVQKFGGKSRNLLSLENNLIRRRFKDPRLHFALNCMSVGCPRLPREAFIADKLEEQLQREALLFLSEERNLRIDHKRKIVYLSKIFDWFERDFVSYYRKNNPGRQANLLTYIQSVSPQHVKARLSQTLEYKIRFVEYDWALNDQVLLMN